MLFRRTVNQNLVAALNPPLTARTLKGSACRDWRGCRFLQRHIGWLQGQFPGIHLARLATQFKLDIEDKLASILPAPDQDDPL